MQGKYLIVDKDLLPSYFEKVAQAMLAQGAV